MQVAASAVQDDLRAFDFCGRFGGEEFMLMAGQTTTDSAKICAERLRRRVESISFPDLADEFRVTISLGVTQYRVGENLTDTINRADEALYRAKNAGRNRVECA